MAVCLALLLLTACAGKHPETWQEDRARINHALKQLNKQQAVLASELKTVSMRIRVESSRKTEARLAALEKSLHQLEKRMRLVERTLVTQEAELKALNAGMYRLQRSTAQLQSRTRRLKRSRQATKRVLTKKINKLAGAIVRAPSGEAATTPGEEEKNHYTAAYLALKSGRYDEAINGFRKLLASYPKGEYADQAWYWLGESLYAQRHLKQAITAFRRVVRHYPRSTKHAAAQLKLALILGQTSHKREARAELQRLLKMHPDSAEADQARALLKAAPKSKPGQQNHQGRKG